MSVPKEIPVVIVGGGPVGLFLACLLTMRGVECLVLERQENIAVHSRAIGLHSPALEVLSRIGITERLIVDGVRIECGRAFWRDRQFARLDLTRVLSGPFPFALSLPQSQTECILEQRLHQIAPFSLQRGATVTNFQTAADGVRVTFEHNGEEKVISTRFLVGCDGKNSLVRERAGIRFIGRQYPDTYLMGDFADNSDFVNEAIIFLTPQGVIEAFPLPEGRRRWVVHTSKTKQSEAAPADLCESVRLRTGQQINADTCTMLSAFGVQDYRAESFVRGNIVLAGDAAHICSPIGGQGMNLGLLDAAHLADTLLAILCENEPPETLLLHYAKERYQAAGIVGRRAAFNTVMGRGGSGAVGRAAIMSALLRCPPTHDHFARQFTMQGL